MNPYEPTACSSYECFETHSNRFAKHWLIAIYSVCGIFGLSQVVAVSSLTVHNVFWLMYAVAVTCWMIADAAARGRRFHKILRVVFFLTWPIASLVYLLATHKIKGVGWWLLNAAAMYGTVAALYYVFYYALFIVGRGDLVDPELFT